MRSTPAPLADAAIMLRRNVRRTLRSPIALFNAILFPVVMLVIFVYVFGGAFSVGERYVDYATPGMLVLAASYGLSATATAVNADRTRGLLNRLTVMDVSRGAVLAGHVLTTVLRTAVALVAILGTAFLLGFRPSASAADWLGVAGLLLLAVVAVGWLTIAVGLAARSPEFAGFATVPLVMLPFLSSAIVPTDRMGAGVRQFAEYQPFTPVIETLRGLLRGTPAAGTAIAAVAWCLGIAVVGYGWARLRFNRRG